MLGRQFALLRDPPSFGLLALATLASGLGTWLAFLGGVLVAATGPDAAYWINAATFLVSAALLTRIPSRVLQAAAAVGHGYWRDLAHGFALIRGSRALLTILATWNVVMLATAGANVSEVVLAKDAFSAGDFGYVVLGLGMLAAGPLTDALGPRTVWAVAGALSAAAALIGLAMARGVSTRREPVLRAQ